MVTENDRRWPAGLHGTPGRFGKLIEYHLFDAPFFSVHGKQASVSRSTASHIYQGHALVVCPPVQINACTETPLHQPGWALCCAVRSVSQELLQCGHQSIWTAMAPAPLRACDAMCRALRSFAVL